MRGLMSETMFDKDLKQQKENVAKEIAEKCRLTGDFTLRSGKKSNVYFDKYQFESDPILLGKICELLKYMIPLYTDVIAGLETGGIPIATVLSRMTGIPLAIIRKEAKTYGTCNQAEGADMVGKNVVLIEDVISTGESVLEAMDDMSSQGVKFTKVICVIDREHHDGYSFEDRGADFDRLYTGNYINQLSDTRDVNFA